MSDSKTESDLGIVHRTLPAGHIVHIGGLPFRLVENTKIVGHEGNFKLLDEDLNGE